MSTSIQIKTLKVIQAYYDKNGFPPSIKEISDECGVVCNAIQGRVGVLHKKGYITKVKGLARSILLTDLGKALIMKL